MIPWKNLEKTPFRFTTNNWLEAEFARVRPQAWVLLSFPACSFLVFTILLVWWLLNLTTVYAWENKKSHSKDSHMLFFPGGRVRIPDKLPLPWEASAYPRGLRAWAQNLCATEQAIPLPRHGKMGKTHWASSYLDDLGILCLETVSFVQ